MHAVIVKFEARPGRAAELRELLLKQAANSLAREPGCRVFDAAASPERPDEFWLYELYDDEDAFRAHRQTEHYLRFARETAPMIREKTVTTGALISPPRTK